MIVVWAPAARADRGDVLVRFKASASAAERASARAAAGVRREAGVPALRVERVDPVAGVGTADAIEHLNRDPEVLYAEPDMLRTGSVSSHDPAFSAQWGLQAINAPAAWEVTVGSPSTLVAVIDSGVELDHPDLAGSLVSGWDYVELDAVPQDQTPEGHGTHVTGVIGATSGNGIGIAGVSWAGQIMPLRVLDSAKKGMSSNTVRAITDAAAAGVRVANLSLGGDLFSQSEFDALAAAEDTLFVAAAGNSGRDNDRAPVYPCSYELANVICVTASSEFDRQRPSWANTGATSVDLAAPGERIFSTVRNGEWNYMDGTSMAAPFVTGAAASAVGSRAPGAAGGPGQGDHRLGEPIRRTVGNHGQGRASEHRRRARGRASDAEAGETAAGPASSPEPADGRRSASDAVPPKEPG